MTGFEAELYLRLAGERMLVHGGDWTQLPELSSLVAAGQALVAVGCAEPELVEAVFEDYGFAIAVRGRGFGASFAPSAAPAGEPLTPARIVSCECELELAIGTLQVRFASLSERRTEVAVTLTFSSSASPFGGGSMHGPISVPLTDDRGTQSRAHFGGTGMDTEMVGWLVSMEPLATDTAYIELDGHRIELVDRPPRGEVWVETLPETDPALRHLWQAVTPEEDVGPAPPLAPAIGALVAAGALSAEHPELAELRAVADALGQGALYGTPVSPGLPEPWRSLFRRRRGRGPEGTLTVGIATPVFDGIAVTVGAIHSHREGWRIDAEVSPPLAVEAGFETPTARARRLVWWALDDRGRHYLGHVGSWSSGEETGHGEVAFSPTLDEQASSIDLMPTAATQRAVIRVPLDWGAK